MIIFDVIELMLLQALNFCGTFGKKTCLWFLCQTSKSHNFEKQQKFNYVKMEIFFSADLHSQSTSVDMSTSKKLRFSSRP